MLFRSESGEAVLSKTTRKTSYSLSDLEVGDYEIRVRATGGAQNASTQFTTASDVTSLKFYYRTMDNSRIRCLDLASINFAKVKYRSVPLDRTGEEFEMIRL